MHLNRFLVSSVVLATTACLVPKLDPDPSTSSSPVSVSTTSGPTPTSEPTTSPLSGSSTDPGTTIGIGSDSIFIITPDAGGTSSLACDTFKQDCDEGEKCTAWANDGGLYNATKCVEVTGNKTPGDICTTEGGATTGIDDCQAGAMCWDVDAQNTGTCVALCTGTPDAPICGPGFECAVTSENVLNLCLPGCDPLQPDCLPGDLCIPTGDGFICTAPAPGDPGQQNDPCELTNACAAGLFCIPPANASSACDQQATGCCQPFCEFIEGEDGTCPNPDQKCLPWFDPMKGSPPGLEDVGICSIPL